MTSYVRASRSIIALAVVWLVCALALAAAQSAASAPAPAGFESIDAYVEQTMRELRIPGLQLAIVQGDRIAHLRAFGVAGPGGRPVSDQTPMPIGSVSKPITAMAVLQLAERGRIELDAPVQRYLPWFRVADRAASAQITVRQLLTMTSGVDVTYGRAILGDTYAGGDAIERAVRGMASVPQWSKPGQAWDYRNSDYVVLGALVQAVSGQAFEDYIAQHVYAPLAMAHSFTAPGDARELATGYTYWFGAPQPMDLVFCRGSIASGYLISTAEDLAHFAVAQLNGGRFSQARLLSVASIGLMHQPLVEAAGEYGHWGMGWNIGDFGGEPSVWKDGELANFQSAIVLLPERHAAVVTISNANDALSGNARFNTIAEGVVAMLAGRMPPAPRQQHNAELPYLIWGLASAILLWCALVIWWSLRRLRARVSDGAQRGGHLRGEHVPLHLCDGQRRLRRGRVERLRDEPRG